MCRHASNLLLISVFLPPAALYGGIGVFEAAEDIPGPGGVGHTEYIGLASEDGEMVEQYEIRGFGSASGGSDDQFHFAYRTLGGEWRLSSDFDWLDKPEHIDAAHGVMIRNSSDEDAAYYSTLLSSDADGSERTSLTYRAENSGRAENRHVDGTAVRVGIQRILIDGAVPAVESIADFGGGWQRVGDLVIAPELPVDAMFGVAVAPSGATSLASDVAYENAEMVGPPPEYAVVPAGAAKEIRPENRAGFVVFTAMSGLSNAWSREQVDELLDLDTSLRLPETGVQTMRELTLVNLYDTGNPGAFHADCGAPDRTFPGIDPFECPVTPPGDGDDDDYFGAEILGIIHLSEGYHVIGADCEGAAAIAIGGVEIGRIDREQGDPATNFLFRVEQEGDYKLHARYLAGEGPAALELHEVVEMPDGSWKRVLLGDTARGGSPVYVPEPATIAVLGLGSLTLLRRRR